MNAEEAKVYIETLSRTGSVLGLGNIQNLMKELDDVQERLKMIHIAGTNGKGSVGAFIESVLLEAGYRVGHYTSPAVFHAYEVWRINRENITQEAYLFYLERIRQACERILKKGMAQPTVFEVGTALAFLYFYEENCDYVLLETGMGGETDATNLITKPVCSVITSVSMDHMQFLGNSLAEIAAVKAGIIKKGCPVVTIDTQKPEVLRVISQKANKNEAELILTEKSWVTQEKADEKRITYQHKLAGRIELSMQAEYQIENSNLAVCVCKKVLEIPDEMIREGIKHTIWPGRFEKIAQKPLIYIDGAHNEDAARKLADTIQNHFTNRKIIYIIGVLADKEYEKILKIMLPYTVQVYTITPPNKRGLDGQILAEEIKKNGKAAVYCKNMKAAVSLAIEEAQTEKADMILAFGSLSYLAELKKCVLEELADGKETSEFQTK